MKLRTLIIGLLLTSSVSVFGMTGLPVGTSAPNLELSTTEGDKINFSKLAKDTVVVFYRGSWCPYCIKQLSAIEKDVISKMGENAQLLAVSVDQLSVAKKMKAKQKYNFMVVSDPKAQSLKAFNIANKLDDKLVKKYKASYKIDVEADSGETHHIVAHPAVYVIKNGKISFVDVQVNYKKRTDNMEILKAL